MTRCLQGICSTHLSYPQCAIDRTRTGTGFPRCSSSSTATFVRRNTDAQSAPRQPGSHEPGHGAERRERGYDEIRFGSQDQNAHPIGTRAISVGSVSCRPQSRLARDRLARLVTFSEARRALELQPEHARAYDLAFTSYVDVLDWAERSGVPGVTRNGTGDLMTTDKKLSTRRARDIGKRNGRFLYRVAGYVNT